jgi:hypothetical protein
VEIGQGLTIVEPPMPRGHGFGPAQNAHHENAIFAYPQKDGAFRDTVLIAALRLGC